MRLSCCHWLKNFYTYIIVYFLCIIAVAGILFLGYILTELNEDADPDYMGSSECRSCHERFYQLWSTSRHGLAMQPYTAAFAEANLKPQAEDIVIGKTHYRAIIDRKSGFIIESESGKQKRYKIMYVLGGKNVYYFLTSLDRGRLQVLPAAYDIDQQQWYDTAASSVRHFCDMTDSPVHWTDRAFTFNTSCYSCHVSQLAKNYDADTDSYHTRWREPGINCETCHGPASEHVKVCLEAAAMGRKPEEIKLNTITQSRGYTSQRVNTACSICHARMVPLTDGFVPGDDFFQHYDLVTLENPDYYPDGRDLGENYTYTSWRMSPCVKEGRLDCVYCHTSSGRYRFDDDNANKACSECHRDNAQNFRQHSHHDPDKGASQCVQCHMPKTRFSRMVRSDHSMRPPVPAATLKYGSPNACNTCHTDKDAAWADECVRNWHNKDYRQKTLDTAGLVDAARKQQWERLGQMLAYLRSKNSDEISANSIVRLLRNCPDKKIQPVLVELLRKEKSPLIRASSADVLQNFPDEKSLSALLKATCDPYRLVRIRAAAALASVPAEQVPQKYSQSLAKATDEYKTSLAVRSDDAASHYNLGNFYQKRGDYEHALESYKTCRILQKDFIPAYVNASIVLNALGRNKEAVGILENAVQYASDTVAVHLNLALLYSELGQNDDAEKEFLETIELDPASAVAAYNLGVLLSERNSDKGIYWCKKAYALEPADSKYACTLAYYYIQADRLSEAIEILQPLADSRIDNPQIYIILAETYIKMNDIQKAIDVCMAAAENNNLDRQTRTFFRNYIKELTGR